MYGTLQRAIRPDRINAAMVALLIVTGVVAPAEAQQAKRYDTPEAALQALDQASEAQDPAALRTVFGPQLEQLLSGDTVADMNEIAEFARKLKIRSGVQENEDGSCTILVGPTAHPFAIPLVQEAGQWKFDTAAGREEILNRRIGENELDTIAVCRAYALAQGEYFKQDHDQDLVLEYAQRLASTPGLRDGLYWNAAPGEPLSPLGEFVARAAAEGYGKNAGDGPRPYHGYVYRIVTRQSAAAPGGAFDYVINRNMVAGFAMVAYPIEYGESGIMTFIINSNGIVYQKDLGENTTAVAAAMTAYDRDDSWTVVQD